MTSNYNKNAEEPGELTAMDLKFSGRRIGLSYVYVVWFIERNLKSSFKSMQSLTRFQATIAPSLPLVCYFMTCYLLFQQLFSSPFPIIAIYISLGIFLMITIVVLWKWMDNAVLSQQFLTFEKLSKAKRRVLDVLVSLYFILAIPVVLSAAVMGRNKFFAH